MHRGRTDGDWRKTHSPDSALGHVVLFSDDLNLKYDKLFDYYRLRFQIEFNFRDAKQFWGLEDFMNVNETPVANAVCLSLLMVHALVRARGFVLQSGSGIV